MRREHNIETAPDNHIAYWQCLNGVIIETVSGLLASSLTNPVYTQGVDTNGYIAYDANEPLYSQPLNNHPVYVLSNKTTKYLTSRYTINYPPSFTNSYTNLYTVTPDYYAGKLRLIVVLYVTGNLSNMNDVLSTCTHNNQSYRGFGLCLRAANNYTFQWWNCQTTCDSSSSLINSSFTCPNSVTTPLKIQIDFSESQWRGKVYDSSVILINDTGLQSQYVNANLNCQYMFTTGNWSNTAHQRVKSIEYLDMSSDATFLT